MPATQAMLPHVADRLYLTDGGIETSLIFDDGLELPLFAAFHLLRDTAGRAALTRYYDRFVHVARNAGAGFVLESPTWRANRDWGTALGYSPAALADANAAAIDLMHRLRRRHETPGCPILVSGCVGPRGDGYVVDSLMSPDRAHAYHDDQIAALTRAGCDLVTAITMTNVPEAIGVARAATEHGVPCVVSFTVETDGRLPSGATLAEAIGAVDTATGAAPAYYMINCAHPSHFAHLFARGGAWTTRVGGLRANASSRSHAELNEAAELDRGEPQALAEAHVAIADRLPGLRVIGGCCGTDHRHVAAMAERLSSAAPV